MFSLAKLLLCAGLVASADDVGTVLPTAPSVPPGTVAAWPADRLVVARDRWMQGDAAGTATILEPWLAGRDGPRGRTRTSAHLLAGMAHLKLEHYNIASSHFYLVRRSGGPLAPYGAWYEALVDHKRGRHRVAARECAAYRDNYPDGIHAAECLLLEGEAYGRAGNRGTSYGRYQQYLSDNPDSPREEEIDVARVQAAALTAPGQAIQMAHALWRQHSYPSTDLAITEILEELAAQGYDTTPPSDHSTRIDRCETLRRSGRFGEAWEMFQELAAIGPESPQIAAWVSRREERFAWSTRNYDHYADAKIATYERSPSGDLAWSIYVAYARSGQWDKATEWGQRALDKHAGHWRWRDMTPVARAEMLSGNYGAAQERFSKMSGEDASFLAAFCAYKAGDLETAAELFGPITSRRGHWQAAAYYWRGQIHLAQQQEVAAREDLDAAIAHDKSGWYRLLQQVPPPPAEQWTRRDGQWQGEQPSPPLTLSRPEGTLTPAAGLLPEASPVVWLDGKTIQGLLTPKTGTDIDWSGLSWPLEPTPVAPESWDPPPANTAIPSPETVGDLPTGYTSCQWFDQASATSALYRAARSHGSRYEDLWAAYDLVQAGLHGEAARLIGPLYEDWKSGAPGPALSSAEWRAVFLATRAHHYATRFCAGIGRSNPDPEARRAAERLAYPVVRAPELWSHSQRFDVDPFLMMGIMRQESAYQEFVVSHAGAIGLVQVMPRTGARVAALMGETRYSPGDLEDPSINIRYGTYYFSRLMERFGGNYPLAIASYNGGPHNVSRWLRQIRGTVTLAEFVEHIPWEETREYVKRVSGHYARYADLYGPAGARLALPGAPDMDDPTVIDF